MERTVEPHKSVVPIIDSDSEGDIGIRVVMPARNLPIPEAETISAMRKACIDMLTASIQDEVPFNFRPLAGRATHWAELGRVLQVLAANDEFGDECTGIAIERTRECLDALADAIDACGKDERSAVEVI